MNNTDATRVLEENKKIIEGQLENIDHDDGIIGLLNDVEHLSVSDRILSVCSGVKPKSKWISTQDFPSNSQELAADTGPSGTYRMLLQSSVSSTCSSFNCSSAESDEVFSEGETTANRRNTMKRCRSWRTFLTIMQWSLQRQSSWVQLAGHQGNFRLSEGGEVLKRFSEVEAVCLQALMVDPLRSFVPQYYGSVNRGGHSYIRLEDLLSGLKNPVIMDCKMGVRTYQEEELTRAQTKPTLRADMYLKMKKADPTAPTKEENEQQGVTKWRYMQWRDCNSSSSTLGFRIEGVMMDNGTVHRDFKKALTAVQVTEALLCFTKSQLPILKSYHSRLQALGESLKESPFFKTHEVIGSSLLFVHDRTSKASIWMIDFGKTIPVPSGMELRHNVPWALGNREDGYLIGLANLSSFLGQAIDQVASRQEKNNEMETTDTNVQQDERKIESQAGLDEQAEATVNVTRGTSSKQYSQECAL
ncbi:hypothetical protein DPEC_G00020220 [Dallia pectoralis]|uniref:Uncharacterized protein n=1 Tax=Dallia pectoralis TaxID=75939 RepID=A0ACC2HG22_DALPE|nr:hypothetical protein DPEC_G00020220 [Dallia pectoralis]